MVQIPNERVTSNDYAVSPEISGINANHAEVGVSSQDVVKISIRFPDGHRQTTAWLFVVEDVFFDLTRMDKQGWYASQEPYRSCDCWIILSPKRKI